MIVKGNQESLQMELLAAVVQAFDEEHPGLRQCKNEREKSPPPETLEVAVLLVPKDSKVFAR